MAITVGSTTLSTRDNTYQIGTWYLIEVTPGSPNRTYRVLSVSDPPFLLAGSGGLQPHQWVGRVLTGENELRAFIRDAETCAAGSNDRRAPGFQFILRDTTDNWAPWPT